MRDATSAARWKVVMLLPALLLAGCFDDQKRQVAQCEAEAMRAKVNASSYVPACMIAAGYTFNPADCGSDDVFRPDYYRNYPGDPFVAVDALCYEPTDPLLRVLERVSHRPLKGARQDTNIVELISGLAEGKYSLEDIRHAAKTHDMTVGAVISQLQQSLGDETTDRERRHLIASGARLQDLPPKWGPASAWVTIGTRAVNIDDIRYTAKARHMTTDEVLKDMQAGAHIEQSNPFDPTTAKLVDPSTTDRPPDR